MKKLAVGLAALVALALCSLPLCGSPESAPVARGALGGVPGGGFVPPTKTGGGGSGDITSVTAGTSLSGGGTSGAVTLNLNIPPTSCSAGDFVRAIGSTGAGTCGTPAGGGDITDVIAGTGLTGGASSGAATVDVGCGSNLTCAANSVDLANSFTISGTGTAAEFAAPILNTGGTLYGPITLALGQTDDWNPGVDKSAIVVEANASGSTISGMVCPASGAGTILHLHVGSSSGTLTILSGLIHTDSAANNRIYTPDGQDLILPPSSGVTLQAICTTGHSWLVTSVGTDRYQELGARAFQLQDSLSITIGAGPINDWDMGLAAVGGITPGNADKYSRVRVTTPSGGSTITGILPPLPSFQDGHILVIENLGDLSSPGATLTLSNYSAGSINDAKILTPDGQDLVIPLFGIATLVYDDQLNYWLVQSVYFGAPGNGDITAVVAGNGLINGGTSGSVTLDVACSTGLTCNANDIAITSRDFGDITTSSSGSVWTIDNDVVTYAKMQNVSATSRFLGRITAGAGDTEELTGTQATSMLDTFSTSGTTKGLVPGSNGATTSCLKGDGTWGACGGGGGITNSAGNNVIMKSDGTNAVASIIGDNGTAATVAGTLSTTGQVTAANNAIYLTTDSTIGFDVATNSATTGHINYYGYGGGATQFRNLQISNGKNNAIAVFTGSSKQVDLYGALTVAGNTTLGDSGSDVTSINGALTLTNDSTAFLKYGAAGGGSYIESGLTQTTGSAAPLYFASMNGNDIWMTIGATGGVTMASTLAVAGNTTLGDASGDTQDFNGDLTKFASTNGDGFAYIDQWGLSGGYSSNFESTTYINYNGYLGTTGQYRNLIIADGQHSTIITVTGNSKAVSMAGALGVVGDFAINTSKFTVAASTGNTEIAGTLDVAGQVSMDGLLNARGDFAAAKKWRDTGLQYGTASCGTSPTRVGGATHGRVTIGSTGTGCIITFGDSVSLTNPSCTVTTSGATKTFTYSVSSTTLTLSSATAAQVYDFNCIGT